MIGDEPNEQQRWPNEFGEVLPANCALASEGKIKNSETGRGGRAKVDLT